MPVNKSKSASKTSPTIKKSRTTPKRPMSTPLRALIIIGGAIAALIAIPIITGLINWVSVQTALDAQVSGARSEEGVQILNSRTELIADLEKRGVISSQEPVYGSLVDACYLDHIDAGWTVQSHRQACYLRYVDVFESAMSIDQYTMYADSEPLRNDNGTMILSRGAATCLTEDVSSFGSSKEVVYYAAEAALPGPCMLPNEEYGYGVVTYAISSIVSNQTTVGERVNFAGGKNYIVLIGDEEYFTKKLGCRPLSLFCEAPINTPRIGDMKE